MRSPEYRGSASISQIDQGQVGGYVSRPDIPIVLRNKGGQVVWNLPENTSEENEQIGIHNIQALFLEKFPEFDELFPRGDDGLIADDKKEDASGFITDRIGTSRDLIGVFGNTPLVKKSCPYFERKLNVVLEKSFNPWGISFAAYFNNGRISLSALSKRYTIAKKTIKSWLQDFPTETIRAKSGHMHNLYREVEVDPVIRDHVEKFSALPRTNQTGRYVDAEGVVWITLNAFRGRFQIHDKTANRFLGSIQSLQGRSGNDGKVISLYQENDLTYQLRDFIDSPSIDVETNDYIDDEGEVWTYADALVESSDFTNPNYHLKSSKIRRIQGRDRVGKRVILYHKREALEHLRNVKRPHKEGIALSPEEAREELQRLVEVEDA